MNEQVNHFIITDTEEDFDFWINQPFVPIEIRKELYGAQILVVPDIDFREKSGPSFPIGTEEVLGFFKKNIPEGATVDICVGDQQYQELALYANTKNLGHFIIVAIVVPLFVNLLTEYIKENIVKHENAIPTVRMLQMPERTTTIDSAVHMQQEKETKKPQHKTPVRRYLEHPEVKFVVTIVDSAGRSKKFEYEGPAKDVEKVVHEMKNLDGNDR